jgi:hypothetical protein
MESMLPATCSPDVEDRAVQYLAGRMSDCDAAAFQAHIGVCGSCRQVVEEARRIIETLTDALPDS